MPEYTHKPWPVAAILWTGENWPDIQQFARDWMNLETDHDGQPCIYNDRDEGWPTESFAYNMVKFEAGGDEEIDPGWWIVVHTDMPADEADPRHRIETIPDDSFRDAYQENPGQ